MCTGGGGAVRTYPKRESINAYIKEILENQEPAKYQHPVCPIPPSMKGAPPISMFCSCAFFVLKDLKVFWLSAHGIII